MCHHTSAIQRGERKKERERELHIVGFWKDLGVVLHGVEFLSFLRKVVFHALHTTKGQKANCELCGAKVELDGHYPQLTVEQPAATGVSGCVL